MIKTLLSKRVRNILLIVFVLFSLYGIYILGVRSRPEVYISNSGSIPYVSISELIDNKGYFHNKTVIVYGYLWIGFEMCEIYENVNNPLTSNQQAICIDFNELVDLQNDTISERRIYNTQGEKVIIIGEYDSVRTGHFSVCRGSISKISNFTYY